MSGLIGVDRMCISLTIANATGPSTIRKRNAVMHCRGCFSTFFPNELQDDSVRTLHLQGGIGHEECRELRLRSGPPIAAVEFDRTSVFEKDKGNHNRRKDPRHRTEEKLPMLHFTSQNQTALDLLKSLYQLPGPVGLGMRGIPSVNRKKDAHPNRLRVFWFQRSMWSPVVALPVSV